MMKLGWGLLNNRDALWARVLRSKYKCGVDLLPTVDKKVPCLDGFSELLG